MKILCWNVNGIRAWSKKGCFDWVLRQDLDIFCFQETKAHPDQLTEDIVKPAGYTSYFDHSRTRKGYSGVAVYVKDSIKNSSGEVDKNMKVVKVDYALGVPELDQEGRFLAVFFKKFVFIDCYFPNGGGGPERLTYKLKYYDAFLKYINKQKKKGLEVIFCGDLNVAHREIDIARPRENSNQTGFLPIERAWVDKLLENDYVDTFRKLYPEKKEAYSWWDMKSHARERNIGWRIDYFFVSKNIEEKIKKAKILSEIFGSDHCPIYLDIDL